jgi:hypothetical protein
MDIVTLPTRSRFSFRRYLPLLTILGMFGWLTPSSVLANEITTKLTIEQSKPNLAHVDLGQKGETHGDMLAFDAEVTTDAGVKGKLSGFILLVDIPEGKDEVSEDRIASMVFDLGNADTLVISGKSVYPYRHKPQMDKNNPQIRAVIGGTGKYIGARGQITTTRNEDETYTHLIELLD